MSVVFDPEKDKINVAKHGISLGRASDMLVLAVIEDRREDYGEDRFRAFGLLDDLPHSLAFTERKGVIRAISLRRAHTKEFNRYAKSQTQTN
jgi:uncharacterized protein